MQKINLTITNHPWDYEILPLFSLGSNLLIIVSQEIPCKVDLLLSQPVLYPILSNLSK